MDHLLNTMDHLFIKTDHLLDSPALLNFSIIFL